MMVRGYVRFFVPNGKYKKSELDDIIHDPVALEGWMNKGICLKWTRNHTHCHYRANIFTNGQWTCNRHVSSTPGTNGLLMKYDSDTICSICSEKCDDVNQWCITSCSHSFHKKCLVKWANCVYENNAFPSDQTPTRFDSNSYPPKWKKIYTTVVFTCPLCRMELELYGMKPHKKRPHPSEIHFSGRFN